MVNSLGGGSRGTGRIQALRHGLRTQGWVAVASLAVVAVVLLVAVGVWVSSSRPQESEQAPPVTARVEEPAVANDSKIRAAFVGDSYVSGAGAPANQGFAPLSAAQMCWSFLDFGQGGTGYTNSGQVEQRETNYPDRLPSVVSAEPDIVVVQGSSNDSEEERIYAYAKLTFDFLKVRLPEATVIVVGPMDPPGLAPEKLNAERRGVSRAASESSVTYVDPVDQMWLPKDSSGWEDDFHPNAEGHKAIADRLVSFLSSLSLPATTGCAP